MKTTVLSNSPDPQPYISNSFYMRTYKLSALLKELENIAYGISTLPNIKTGLTRVELSYLPKDEKYFNNLIKSYSND